MKLVFSIILILLYLTSNIFANVKADTVVTGNNYKNEIYYSLKTGNVKTENNENWDIAFEIPGIGVSININDGFGVKLYHLEENLLDDWDKTFTVSEIDSNWTPLYNSKHYWNYGAFIQVKDMENDFDLGWGEYNMATHTVIARTFYVIKTLSGKWKKIIIDHLASSVYTFRIANLDGTEEIERKIQKNNFFDRIFAYYSIDNDEILDREPDIFAWDLNFSKYISMEGPNQDTPYSVTGIRQNPQIKVARVSTNEPTEQAPPNVEEFSSLMTTIGSDWKNFDGTKFVVRDNLVFFVMDREANIHRLIFTGFDGSSTGAYYFNIYPTSTSVLEVNNMLNSLAVEPNIISASENPIIVVNLNNILNAELEVYSAIGERVYSQKMSMSDDLQQIVLNTQNLAKGMYIVALKTKYGVITEKLIIN